MLHVGILPNHRAWADFLHRLDVVVVDEAHVYRGVFGSHVGQRPAAAAAARRRTARFLLASATIANPVELAERLTGLDEIALVDRDGSPKARRQIAIWNPPLIDEALGVAALRARRGGRPARRARARRRRGRSASSSRARRSS